MAWGRRGREGEGADGGARGRGGGEGKGARGGDGEGSGGGRGGGGRGESEWGGVMKTSQKSRQKLIERENWLHGIQKALRMDEERNNMGFRNNERNRVG